MKRSINIFRGGSFIRRTPPAAAAGVAMNDSLLMANGGHRSDYPNAAAADDVSMLEMNSYAPPMMRVSSSSTLSSPNVIPVIILLHQLVIPHLHLSILLHQLVVLIVIRLMFVIIFIAHEQCGNTCLINQSCH